MVLVVVIFVVAKCGHEDVPVRAVTVVLVAVIVMVLIRVSRCACVV